MNTPDTSLTIKSPGFWMVALGGLLMAVNSVRAFNDPAAFATYLGLPLAAPGDAALIHIYALRALFIALLVAALLFTRQRRALALFSVCAVVMPVGDALLTSAAGAPTGTVLRHAAIAIYLLFTAFALWPRGVKADAQ